MRCAIMRAICIFKNITRDTGGSTEHVFALTALLGFRFAPRLRDALSRHLYLVNEMGAYGSLNSLLFGQVKSKLIIEQWDEMRRVASSIRFMEPCQQACSCANLRPILVRTQVTQQGRGLDLHPQSWSQALTYLSTGGEPQGFQLFQETIADPCPGLDQIGKAFGKNFSWACRCPASKLAHTEPKHHVAASTWHIVDRAPVLTMDVV